MCLPQWQSVKYPVVGMLHLLPLPGSPAYRGDTREIAASVLRDAEALVAGGVHGLLLENFGDAPFFPGSVPSHVVANMTKLAVLIRQHFDAVPIGVNVLRNDAVSALSIAQAAGAQFIRVNVLSGARVTDQGIIQGKAHELMRVRVCLNATAVKVFADVEVKHSASLASQPIEEQVNDLIHRARADGLIVSGSATGKPADVAKLKSVKENAAATPVFVGSGVSPTNIADYLPFADGFIVGSSLKRDGVATAPVDPQRVAQLMDRLA